MSQEQKINKEFVIPEPLPGPQYRKSVPAIFRYCTPQIILHLFVTYVSRSSSLVKTCMHLLLSTTCSCSRKTKQSMSNLISMPSYYYILVAYVQFIEATMKIWQISNSVLSFSTTVLKFKMIVGMYLYFVEAIWQQT